MVARLIALGVAAPWVVSDELWERIEPLLPVRPAGRTGPQPLPDRAVLQGILFVLYTGIGGEDLPQELGFGSGMTCWRRAESPEQCARSSKAVVAIRPAERLSFPYDISPPSCHRTRLSSATRSSLAHPRF